MCIIVKTYFHLTWHIWTDMQQLTWWETVMDKTELVAPLHLPSCICKKKNHVPSTILTEYILPVARHQDSFMNVIFLMALKCFEN